MKKSAKLAVGLGIAAMALPVAMLAPGFASRTQKAPFRGRNFAHRGLHTEDRVIPENSLSAFARAAEAGYGIELDVRLTKDGQVVIFHDDTLDRVCGLSARVEEMTYSELLELRLYGTDEVVPRLSETLDLVAGRVPLMIELKSGTRSRTLCRKTVSLLKKYHGPVCVVSFDPFLLAWFRFHAPKYLRGQLAAPGNEYKGWPAPVRFLLSHTLFNFIGRPQMIAYKIGPKPLAVKVAELLGKAKGAMKAAWISCDTVNEKGEDVVIFEGCRPLPFFH